MNKTILGIAKINLKQIKPAYWTTGAVFLLAIANIILMAILFPSEDNSTIAMGNYLYLLPLLAAILIPARNFTKLMNLGAKRMDFFKGCILSYLPVILAVSLLDVLLRFILDSLMLANLVSSPNLLDAFGFMRRGAVVAFFQMGAFLLLFCCVLHSLTLAQGHWYGWVADVLIIAVISVFTPIAPLRAVLVWFFRMIIFHDSALVQIASCLVFGAAIYYGSLIPIESKCA
jgi:hypothetical protein